MGLEVANIVGRVGVDYDPGGLDRFDRDWEKAERKARRGIDGKVTVDVDKAGRGLDDYGRKVRQADDHNQRFIRGSGRLRTSLGTMFVGGASAAAAGIGFGILAKQTMDAVGAFEESEAISKRTANVLKTTGGAANVTAAQISNLATSLSKKSGIDDEAIQSGENLLLTFTNVRNEVGKGNDVFTQATKTAVDMSAALGQDLKSSNIQLGKALNDPIKGITALSRVGVSFTAQQKEQIKTLTESGNRLGAQKIILKELGREFGGAAEASATSSGKMKVALGNVQEAVGKAVAPAFRRASSAITSFANGMTEGTGTGGRFVQVMRNVGGAISGAFSSAVKVGGRVLDGFRQIIDDNRDKLRSIGRTVGDFAKAWGRAFGQIGAAFKDVFGGDSGMGRDIRNIVSKLLTIVDAATKLYVAIVKRVLPGIVDAFRGFAQMVRGVVRIVSGILSGDFGKAWKGVKDIFSGAFKAIVGLFKAATKPIRDAVGGIGKAIGGAFSSVWRGILGTAASFVNKIIDVINIIPGVNIKHVGKQGVADQTLSDAKAGKTTNSMATEFPQKLARGGKVTAPIAIMGEEAPEHPEWVIPTNPAYRKRAVSLWAMAAKELGIPGFALGGLFDAAKSAAGSAAKTVVPGLGAVTSAADMAGDLIGKLPKNPGGILSGTWGWTRDKAEDYIRSKAKGAFDSVAGAVSGAFSGGGSSGGLVPQVLRAISWARSHGWGGRVISGYRDPASQIAAAQQYAARRGMPLSALYPNGVLASNHTTGQAIDVTDPEGFRRAMAGAPAGSRLLGLVSGDPAHFSVTGHRRGGILGLIGGLGGELLASGTMAYRKGGKTKKAPKPVLSKRDNSGIKRSVQRGERGISGFESGIQTLEREYDQMDREFGLSEEVWLVENEDGSVTLDTGAQKARGDELQALIDKRGAVRQKIVDYRTAIQKLRGTLKTQIDKLKKALGKAKGKARQKERGGYRQAISDYTTRRNELQTTYKDLGFDRKDSDLDLTELENEKTELFGATGAAAPAEDPEPPPEPKSPELADFLVGGEAGRLDTLTRETALDEIGAGTLPGGVDDNNAEMTSILRGVLERIKTSAPTEIVTALAQQIAGLSPKDASGSSGTDTATDIAAGVVAALASFNNSRADLFRSFGANFSTVDRMLNPSAAEQAAGLRQYGGGQSGTQGGVQQASGGVVQHLYFPQAPPDAHTFTQQALHELQAAL